MRAGSLWKRILALALSGACLTMMVSGCGQKDDAAAAGPGGVELLNPVGEALTYEAADYRNLYDVRGSSALVCPYAEEYAPNNVMYFNGYGSLPGEEVQKGDVLMYSDTEDLEKQIEDMEESIADKEESYREYVQEAEEGLAQPRADMKMWGGIVEDHEGDEPEQDTPEHEKWAADHNSYEAKYRNALISVQRKEEALRQRTGLYELDSAYDKVLLARLKEDLSENSIICGMSGVVANVRVMNYGNYMGPDTPMAAVADLDRKLVKCEYISKAAVNKAQEYYAVINGKRYGLEYEVMEPEEYERISKKNDGKAYTTFYLQDDADEVEMGSFATIILVNQKKENVLTVPSDAVARDENTSYVYVVRDGKSVYTPVKTGMTDGFYTEILSGVEAGELILTEQAPEPGKSTVKLEKGGISNQYTATGYLFYPIQKEIKVPVEHGTIYYVSTNVELNQQVKKGDPLFTIRVVADEVELARSTKRLQREQERMDDLIRQDAEANKKAIAARQETIAEIEKEIAEMKADFATTEISAPYDGIVTGLPWREMKEGDLLTANQAIATLAAQGSNYIVIEDTNGLLTYGNQASIQYKGMDGKDATVSGMVVSLSPYSVSSDFFDENQALIKVSSEDIGDMAGSADGYEGWWNRSRFNVSVINRSMENVVLVPKKAVISKGSTTYVRVKQENGEIRYQGFVAGGSDNSYYWVVEGLTEGMEICLE